MKSAHTVGWLIVLVAALLLPQALSAQECVRWSTFSCVDQPKPGRPAPAPDVIRLGIKAPSDAIEPDVRKLYRVDLKCNSTQLLPAPNQGIFNRTDLVTTHLVAITTKALTGQELPADAKVLIPVYSVSTAKANESNFVNKACNTSFFISGREPLFLAATANQTRTNSPSAFSNLLYGGLKLFNPIWPLFAGASAVAAIQPILSGIGATEAPLKELLSKFDSKGTQTYSSPLYIGETNVRTPYTRTTVTVKEVPSIIQTDNGKFIVSFEDSLKGYWEEIRVPALDGKAVAANCRSYSGQLVAKNFPADDIIYALSYITVPAGLDTEKSVRCLGKEYGLRSVELYTCPPPGTGLKCLWNRVKNPLAAKDFTDPYPPQKYEPAFFKGLVNTMADYAVAGPTGDENTRATLAKYFQRQIELEDFERLVKGKDGQVSPAEFMQQLVDSGFEKFGCDVKDTQAAGLLFGFPPKPSSVDQLYHGEDLVALRTWRGEPAKPGEPGKVFKVEALFQPGLAEAAAKPTLMWCGRGLHLARTPEPENQREPAGGAGQ